MTTTSALTAADLGIDGRVALVTGGGRGIGRAISISLAGAGARVAVNYARDDAAAAATVDEIRAAGGTAIAVRAEVEALEQDEAMVATVTEQLGPIGILVNNAGIASRGRKVADTDPDECARVLGVHAIGSHHLCRLVLPAMRTQERGDVVFLSSAAAHMLTAGGAPYNMGKAAIEALAHTLAKEEVAHGIHVNIVAPGLVASEMGDKLIRAVTRGASSAAADLDSESPYGHVCRPEEVADVVRYLVSAQAGYLTSQRIVVDGGANTHRP